MSIYIVSQNQKATHDLVVFGQTIFNNFRELVQYPKLKHNMKEIMRVIKSPRSIIMFKMYKGKIIGYVLGEIMNLNDGRNVFYITYIFTSPHFRGKGIASELMKTVSNIVEQQSLDGILLTCDSEDTEVYSFYEKRGFMPDLNLRTYDKFEVLFK
jgi:ribosomal protein S18 acetylase RimI-like enzyme